MAMMLESPWILHVGSVMVAVLLDRCWGEPPVRWHPVVWMGNYLQAMASKVAPLATVSRPSPDIRALLLGVGAWSAGALCVTLVGMLLSHLITTFVPGLWGAVMQGVLLKPMFSWTMMEREVLAVDVALSESLTAGRIRLSYLCSRETEGLSEVSVRETAIESLAENLNDSVVAPLFWFSLLGLPGAVLYRYANTADAMWGYRGQRQGHMWEWAGKWAARVDDALSWVPARITGLTLLAWGRFRRQGDGAWLDAWRNLWREAQKTPSPNGGWPMAAMALVLNVRLSKPGVYELNPEGRDAASQDTISAVSMFRWAAVLGVGMSLLIAALGTALASGGFACC